MRSTAACTLAKLLNISGSRSSSHWGVPSQRLQPVANESRRSLSLFASNEAISPVLSCDESTVSWPKTTGIDVLSSPHVPFTPKVSNQSMLHHQGTGIWTGRIHSTNAAASPAEYVPTKYQTAKMFEKCWERVRASLKGDPKLPREIVWLNGAPGAGKGANTGYILDIRGLNRAITMSDLLKEYPEAKALKDEGKLVPDEVVIEAVLKAIINPEENDGVGLVVDGFPRSAMQVDIVQALFDQMENLHNEHYDAPDSERYPRPCFKIVILYVDEKTSVDRQVFRVKKAMAQNRAITDAGGLGKQREERSTDLDIEKAMARYDTFKRNYSTVLKLKEHFPFSIIDGMGTLEESEAQIARELRYQSSLDLYEETYRLITPIPLVYEIVKEARMKLVDRLNSYVKSHKPLLEEVVSVIHEELLPQIRKCGQAGFTEFRTRDEPFKDSTMACQMLIDVLADRGFSCSHTVEERLAPHKFDLQTGEIFCQPWITHCFRVSFAAKSMRSTPPREDRRLSATDVAERIGTTSVPIGFDHSEKPGMSRQRKPIVRAPSPV